MGRTQPHRWLRTAAMTDRKNEIGSLVKDARTKRGLTQGQLAELTGITQQTIAKIEQGKIRVSRQLPKLMKELGVSLSSLGEEAGMLITAGEIGSSDTNARGLASRTISPDPDKPWVLALQMSNEGQLVTDWLNIGSLAHVQKIADGPNVLAFYVAEDVMSPAIEPGDVVALHARLPVLPGADCAFIDQRGDDSSTNRWLVEIRRLVAVSAESWTVQQFNPPKTYELPRERFQARRVVAIYRRI